MYLTSQETAVPAGYAKIVFTYLPSGEGREPECQQLDPGIEHVVREKPTNRAQLFSNVGSYRSGAGMHRIAST
jgi:hypothetical protein